MNFVQYGSYLLAALFGLIGLNFFKSANGQCNSCSMTTGLACVSQNQFKICIGSTPINDPITCPVGYVCSTNDSAICQLNQNAANATCGACNVCNANRTFACTGPQTFALCLGNTTPSNITGSCGTNLVCNVDLQTMCGKVTAGVTCSGLDASVSPQQYCQNVGKNGRFSVTGNCRQYIFCVSNSGIWTSQLYTCPERTYFNSTSGLCVDAMPQGCV